MKLRKILELIAGFIGICFSIYLISLACKNPSFETIFTSIAFILLSIFIILEGLDKMKEIDKLKVKIRK